MYAVKVLAMVLAISTAAGLGACSKAQGLGEKAGNTAEASAQQGSVNNVSNAELQALLDKGVTLVDIRLPEEWQQTGVVEGSKLLTLFEKSGAVAPNFLANLQKVAPVDKPVALICRTGNRTRAGAEMLAQAGYSQVYNVTHGITGWIKEGKAVARQ
ncbi:MAG: rhodanese-like domain-containing protein [Gammaproteobacteria bacterium]|nr:rhodanese-like domain-containing protein [Gammaproteobacteria bacterium]MBU1724002.1 rhodanese-like domain-containing protein [Gammaproteobacteria bacterium]MBU2006929.1 rhodanese-like domain-containing protein [Gammaproteobacteria bacterium]